MNSFILIFTQKYSLTLYVCFKDEYLLWYSHSLVVILATHCPISILWAVHRWGGHKEFYEVLSIRQAVYINYNSHGHGVLVAHEIHTYEGLCLAQGLGIERYRVVTEGDFVTVLLGMSTVRTSFFDFLRLLLVLCLLEKGKRK